jgi:DNA-binding FrmR family transcriptional regulator
MNMTDNDPQKEAFRQEVASRLDRIAEAAGQIRQSGQDERRCEALLEQLAALRGELDQAVFFILEHHFDRCIRDAMHAGREDEVIRGIKRSVSFVIAQGQFDPACSEVSVENDSDKERRVG